MAKRQKLTHKQKRQVNSTLKRRKANLEVDSRELAGLGQPEAGRVVGRFGQHADIEDKNGVISRCNIRRNIDSVVVGDKVIFRQGEENNPASKGVVEIVEERKSVLTRPDYYDGIKPIAANIDQILIVSSILPTLSLNIIDRYLVAAEDVMIEPILIVNKVELLLDDERDFIEAQMAAYRDIGYRVIFTSCKTREGIEELELLLNNKVSIFVGQSGVGKSSIVNQLLPEAQELTNDVSANSGLGQHTTTASKLLPFRQGGDLIDSPGVREFALWHLPPERVAWGFVEFRDYLGSCKFRDCKHLDDPGCALRAAVEDEKISEERFENYHRILVSMNENKPSRNIPKKV